jgi:hypothetical protein
MEEGMLMEMQEDWELTRVYLRDEATRKRVTIFLATLFCVIPFCILDLYYGLSSQQRECMDQQKLFNAISLRSWMLIIGVI